jgi:hypothetical protein
MDLNTHTHTQACALAAFAPSVLAGAGAEEDDTLEFSRSMGSGEGPGTANSTDSGVTTRESPGATPPLDVEVDQHVPAARFVDVESPNVRRRSLCVQQPLVLSPPPPPPPPQPPGAAVGGPTIAPVPMQPGQMPSLRMPPLLPEAATQPSPPPMAPDGVDIQAAVRAAVAAVQGGRSYDSDSPLAVSSEVDSITTTAASGGGGGSGKGVFRLTTPTLRAAGDSPDPSLVDVDDSSTVAHGAATKSFNVKSHPVDPHALEQSICEGSHHSREEVFRYHIKNLRIRRQIDMDVDLNVFDNMSFLTEGSNSHIFAATWQNQPVIVKMLQSDKSRNAIALHEFEVEAELLTRIDHPNIVKVMLLAPLCMPLDAARP